MSNEITNLTNTRWILNEVLTGSNKPACDSWTNSYYDLIANIDNYPISGFAYVKKPSIMVLKTLNPNLDVLTLPNGALLFALNEQASGYSELPNFITNCSYAGMPDFDIGPFVNAYYLSMQVVSTTGGGALLRTGWSSNIRDRVLTIYGGADVTNPDLIEWLQENAVLDAIVTPSLPWLSFKPLLIGEPYEEKPRYISFAPGFNKIKVTFRSNMSLNYIDARITRLEDLRGVNVGQLGDQIVGSLAANTFYDLVINVNRETFIYGGGAYVLSIYAKSATDGTWSETLFLLTVGEEQVVTVDDYLVEVVDREHTLLPYDPPLVAGDRITLNGAWTLIQESNELSIT